MPCARRDCYLLRNSRRPLFPTAHPALAHSRCVVPEAKIGNELGEYRRVLALGEERRRLGRLTRFGFGSLARLNAAGLLSRPATKPRNARLVDQAEEGGLRGYACGSDALEAMRLSVLTEWLIEQKEYARKGGTAPLSRIRPAGCAASARPCPRAPISFRRSGPSCCAWRWSARPPVQRLLRHFFSAVRV